MAKNRKNKKKLLKNLAQQHIVNYFNLAKQTYQEDFNLAQNYIKNALRISSKLKVPIPREEKRFYCRHCKIFLVPSLNARVRLHRKRMIYLCLNCKHIKRVPIK